MKVIISQPMKDLTAEEIRANRSEAVAKLNTMGYDVVDTVFNFEDVEGLLNKPLYYLAQSLVAIATVDAVYFMKGYENARGCRIEHDCCKAYGVESLYED